MNTSPILSLRLAPDIVKDLRVMFAARVSPIVKRMIAAEAAARDRSEGELLDDLVLAACRSPEAMRLLSDYARTHPLVVAFHEVTALRETAKEQHELAPKHPPPKRKAG